LASIFLITFIPVSTPEPQTPGSSPSALEFAPIVVHIAYSLRDPIDGLEFVFPNDSYPFVSFHSSYFTSFRRTSSVFLMHIRHRHLLILHDVGFLVWITFGKNLHGNLSLSYRDILKSMIYVRMKMIPVTLYLPLLYAVVTLLNRYHNFINFFRSVLTPCRLRIPTIPTKPFSYFH